jgi:hypothetical protein
MLSSKKKLVKQVSMDWYFTECIIYNKCVNKCFVITFGTKIFWNLYSFNYIFRFDVTLPSD